MNNLANLFQIGFYEGLTWFPIVLAIGIIYKYLKTIDVSIDGITVISSIIFTVVYNYFGSLILAFLLTICFATISYAFISFLINELKINNILAGIILSLLFHSLSVIFIGESLPLKYVNLKFLSNPSVILSIIVLLAILTELFFRTNFGIKLKVAADNPNVNISSNPRLLTLIIYVICGVILSFGVVLYTSKLGLSRSGGGFEFLITALSSFLFIDRVIDLIINAINKKQAYYTYKKYLAFSLLQSPVFKAFLGSVLFQIIVLLIIYYTNNPAYWKLIFGIILLLTIANPKFTFFSRIVASPINQEGITLRKLSFQYDNGYEKRNVFIKLDFHFEPGINIIWGNNGVGKTTLLKLISGIFPPDSGSIFKNGVDMINKKKNNRKVFYITQTPYNSLSTNMTVFENVAAVNKQFSKKDFNISKSSYWKDKNNLISEFEFGKQNPFWVQRTGSLSGGQAQKLNLFLCSISSADLILLDEPTSGMDNENFKVFLDFVKNIKQKNDNLIIVTHDDRLKGISGNHALLSNNELIKQLCVI